MEFPYRVRIVPVAEIVDPNAMPRWAKLKTSLEFYTQAGNDQVLRQDLRQISQSDFEIIRDEVFESGAA